MTVDELSQLCYLNREIEFDQERLRELERKASAPATPQMTGMPRTHDNASLIERYAAEIVDLQAIIAAKQIQCIHERARLERYIADIEDSELRWIFKLRFVNGLPWTQVAASMGEGFAMEAVKKRCYRYLRRKNESVPPCPDEGVV